MKTPEYIKETRQLEGKTIKFVDWTYSGIIFQFTDEKLFYIFPSEGYEGEPELDIEQELSLYDLKDLKLITKDEFDKLMAQKIQKDRINEEKYDLQTLERLAKKLGKTIS